MIHCLFLAWNNVPLSDVLSHYCPRQSLLSPASPGNSIITEMSSGFHVTGEREWLTSSNCFLPALKARSTAKGLATFGENYKENKNISVSYPSTLSPRATQHF